MKATAAEQDAFLTAHPDLYHRATDGSVRVAIHNGTIAVGSLATPGLGAGPTPDFDSMNKSSLPNSLPQAEDEARRAHA
jgi:hypothetical protein